MPDLPPIRKAVFPVAGLGTRFLPATKAIPKEMLPIVDKPLIQYGVEEAVEAGVDCIIFVINRSKRAILDHFAVDEELHSTLLAKGDDALAACVSDIIPEGVEIQHVFQEQALGLGHAVWCARDLVGDEPFAVILADDLIRAPQQGCIQQMVEVYEATGAAVIGVEEIPAARSDRYGIVSVELDASGRDHIREIVEKPAPWDAPSNLGVVGRYILPGKIFPLLESVRAGVGGEIQLTDAIASLLGNHVVLAHAFSGNRYDCGSRQGFIRATVDYALDHEELRADLLAHFKKSGGVESMPVREQPNWPQGKVVCLKHLSKVLEGNPWSDPVQRDLNVYLPAGYSESAPAYTALWDFAAFTNAGPGHLNWRGQGENLPQRLDRLIGSGEMPPVIVPMPDCYTSLGGNQYINSGAVGRYADYIVEELVPFLADHVNVRGERSGRGAFGKSSGGYGALVHAMYYPETWGGAASHAGDVGFDWVYQPEFPRAAAVLSALDGDPYRFLQNFWNKKSPGGLDYSVLMTLAMAASYDPGDDPNDPIRLPFDLHTLTLDTERWERWLQHDPLRLLETYAEQLASLELLYIDVGSRDQYNIQYGTRAFVACLEKLGIKHHFEEFDGTHSGMDWRLDTSLPMLAKALGKDNGADSPQK